MAGGAINWPARVEANASEKWPERAVFGAQVGAARRSVVWCFGTMAGSVENVFSRDSART